MEIAKICKTNIPYFLTYFFLCKYPSIFRLFTCVLKEKIYIFLQEKSEDNFVQMGLF